MLADLQVGQHAQSLQPNTSLISAGSNPTLHRRIAAVPEQRSQQAHHERVNYSGRVVVGAWRGRLARWFAEENLPFALSLSKGLTAWFDRLTISGSLLEQPQLPVSDS